MRKSLLLLIGALLFAPSLGAQVLFIDSTTAAAQVYVVGRTGGTPTLFVQGGVDIEGQLHITNNGTDGLMQVVDGATDGDVTITDVAGGGRGSITITNAGQLSLSGDFSNNGSLNAAVGSIVEFTDLVTSQAYDDDGLQAEAQRDFGIVQVNGREIFLNGAAANDDNMVIMAGGQMSFGATVYPGNYVRTGTNSFVVMRDGATWVNNYNGAGSAGVSNDDQYVWGNVRRYMANAGAQTQVFPVGVDFAAGANAGAQPFTINLTGNPITALGAGAYMEVSFNSVGLPTLTPSGTTPTCGFDDIQSYSGRWTYHIFNSAGVQQESVAGVTYTLNVKPHDFAAPVEAVFLVDHLCATCDPYYAGLRVLNTNNSIPDYSYQTATLVPCVVGADPGDMTIPGAAALTFFSEISGGSPVVNPLPVEMLPLQAEGAGDHIRVYWTTLKEVNTSHFVLERSLDAQNFQVIASNIPAAENSNQPIDYDFDDNNAQYNTPYFYRLRTVDMDGTETMSNIAEAMILRDGSSSWASFYPNPANSTLNLRVFSEENATMNLRMFDATGRLVYVADQELEAGTTDIDLASALSRMAAGNYNAVLMIGNEVSTTKLVITD